MKNILIIVLSVILIAVTITVKELREEFTKTNNELSYIIRKEVNTSTRLRSDIKLYKDFVLDNGFIEKQIPITLLGGDLEGYLSCICKDLECFCPESIVPFISLEE